MANQRTVKFLRSLSLKWCLPTFPFQGEITLVDSKKIPTFQGRVTGFGKNVQPYDNIRAEKVSFYFQIILWSWGFVTLCTDRVTSRPPQKKLDLVGNKPPPPAFLFVWSCQLIQCLGLLCRRQCFFVSNDCHDFKTQSWPSLAGVHKLATGWLWCPGKNENGLKCCRLSFVYRTLKIIQVIFGCFQACCFAIMMF